MASGTRFLASSLFSIFAFWIIACGDSPADPDSRLIPIPVALDVSNEDGFVDEGGFFNSAEDHFVVGEGGDDNPNELVYEITVTNTIDLPIFVVEVNTEVAPHSGILVCRSLLDQAPGGAANPSIGAVTGGDCSPEGFRWDVGSLDGGTTASLYFRAEALADGDDVHRVAVSASGLPSDLVIEEPSLIGGSGPPLSLIVADGHIDETGAFQSAIDPHFVGDGGPSDPTSLVYEISVINQGARTATGVEVSASIPQMGAGFSLACREILPSAPGGGDNPNIGSASCTSGGLAWNVGNLGEGIQAVLYARVEARSVGNHVSRVILRADALSQEVNRDEVTPVLP